MPAIYGLQAYLISPYHKDHASMTRDKVDKQQHQLVHDVVTVRLFQ